MTLQIVTAVLAGVGARRAAIARRANQVLQAVGSCCEANVVPPGVAPDAIVPAGGAADLNHTGIDGYVGFVFAD